MLFWIIDLVQKRLLPARPFWKKSEMAVDGLEKPPGIGILNIEKMW